MTTTKKAMRCRCQAEHGALSRRNALMLLAALGAGAGAAQAQDAVKAEPRSYRLVFENAKVRVLEYVARPGMGVCGAGLHSHPDHVAVALTPAKVKVMQDGKTFVADVKSGAAFWEPAATHMAENVGGSGSRFVLIEIKDRQWSPSTG